LNQKNAEATVVLSENQVPFYGRVVAEAMIFLPEIAVKRPFTRTDIDLNHDEYAHFFLFNAAEYGHEHIFCPLVAQYGGINVPVNETTAFHMACRSVNPRSINLALELGANVSTTEGQGNKPLHALVTGNKDKKYATGANLRL
jgi:hypothetical protein